MCKGEGSQDIFSKLLAKLRITHDTTTKRGLDIVPKTYAIKNIQDISSPLIFVPDHNTARPNITMLSAERTETKTKTRTRRKSWKDKILEDAGGEDSHSSASNLCLHIIEGILFLGYIALDLMFSDPAIAGNYAFGTIVPNITNIITIENQKGLQLYFGIMTAFARGLTLCVLFLFLHRVRTCTCFSLFRHPANPVVNTKSIEMISMNTKTTKPPVKKMNKKKNSSSNNTYIPTANNVQYQPPAVRNHTAALESSMQDDFSQSMHARQRQAFGIDRDMSYRHKPTQGFELPKERTVAIGRTASATAFTGAPAPGTKNSSGSGSGDVGGFSGSGNISLPSISVSEAVAMGPSNKQSRFVQAHVVEQELERLHQEVGQMRVFFEQLAKQVEQGTGVHKSHHGEKKGKRLRDPSQLSAMTSGKSFHDYSKAKQLNSNQRGKLHTQSSLMQKKSMSLM